MNIVIGKVEFRFIFDRIKQNEMFYEKLSLRIIFAYLFLQLFLQLELLNLKKAVKIYDWYISTVSICTHSQFYGYLIVNINHIISRY